MLRTLMPSPVGPLEITEHEGAIVSLGWSAAGASMPDRPSPLLAEAERQLRAYFAGRLRRFDLPLKPGGSPFRAKAWRALRRIPFGETVSYGELARRLASSPRAVGGACGANPIAIVIPCHRVLGADGSLGGYSGAEGIETKRFLLELEGVNRRGQASRTQPLNGRARRTGSRG